MSSYRRERIQATTDDLVAKYDSRDPFVIAKAEGIEVVYRTFDRLKGFYTRFDDQSFIVLNQELSPVEMKLTCAHELGHDQLHQELAEDRILQEFMFYDLTRQPEYEANLFAAGLLLDEADVREGLEAREDFFVLAAKLEVDPMLLHLKLRLMDFPAENLPDYDDRFLQHVSSS